MVRGAPRLCLARSPQSHLDAAGGGRRPLGHTDASAIRNELIYRQLAIVFAIVYLPRGTSRLPIGPRRGVFGHRRRVDTESVLLSAPQAVIAMWAQIELSKVGPRATKVPESGNLRSIDGKLFRENTSRITGSEPLDRARPRHAGRTPG